MQKSARKNAFTLIELLVVIAIIGVLAAVVLIAINPARRLAQARDSGRKSDVGQIATAAQAFFTTYGRYPTTLSELVSSGDLKQVPSAISSGNCNGSYSLTLNNASTPSEAGVYVCIEAPTSGAANTIWNWRSSTGQASEVATANY